MTCACTRTALATGRRRKMAKGGPKSQQHPVTSHVLQRSQSEQQWPKCQHRMLNDKPHAIRAGKTGEVGLRTPASTLDMTQTPMRSNGRRGREYELFCTSYSCLNAFELILSRHLICLNCRQNGLYGLSITRVQPKRAVGSHVTLSGSV